VTANRVSVSVAQPFVVRLSDAHADDYFLRLKAHSKRASHSKLRRGCPRARERHRSLQTYLVVPRFGGPVSLGLRPRNRSRELWDKLFPLLIRRP
jgi:hypothetical protein